MNVLLFSVVSFPENTFFELSSRRKKVEYHHHQAVNVVRGRYIGAFSTLSLFADVWYRSEDAERRSAHLAMNQIQPNPDTSPNKSRSLFARVLISTCNHHDVPTSKTFKFRNNMCLIVVVF